MYIQTKRKLLVSLNLSFSLNIVDLTNGLKIFQIKSKIKKDFWKVVLFETQIYNDVSQIVFYFINAILYFKICIYLVF